MKTFRHFLSTDPVLITSMPVHGSHAQKKLTEAKGTHGPDESSHSVSKWLNQNGNHHIAETPAKVHKALNVSKEEHAKRDKDRAIYQYSEYSHGLNRYHIKPESRSLNFNSANKEHARHTKALDKALNKSKLKHDVHVYHGMNDDFHIQKEADKHPERKIKMPGYTSTSLDKKTAEGFGNSTWEHDKDGKFIKYHKHILHVHLKKGQKATYIGSHSHFHGEKEMLLPRNTTLKIHKHVDHIKGKKMDLHIHHATVVDDK